jgi:hypothetical protein
MENKCHGSSNIQAHSGRDDAPKDVNHKDAASKLNGTRFLQLLVNLYLESQPPMVRSIGKSVSSTRENRKDKE